MILAPYNESSRSIDLIIDLKPRRNDLRILTALVIFVSLSPPVAISMAIGGDRSLFGTFGLLLSGIVLGSTVTVLSIIARIRKDFGALAGRVSRALQRSFSLQQIAPVSPVTVLPEGLRATVVPLAFLILLGTVIHWMGGYAGALLAICCSPILALHPVEKVMADTWVLNFTKSMLVWGNVCRGAIGLTVLISFLSGLLLCESLRLDGHREGMRASVFDALNAILSAPPAAYERPADFADSTFRSVAGVVASGTAWSGRVPPSQAIALILAGAYGLVAVLAIAGGTMEILSVPSYWKAAMGSERPPREPGTPSSASARTIAGLQIPIMAFAAATGLSLWMSELLTIDIIAFLATGRCLIWTGLAWQLALLERLFNLIGFTQPIGSSLGKVAVILPAIPGAISLMVVGRYLCRRLGEDFRLLVNRRLRGNLSEIRRLNRLLEISRDRLGCQPPDLFVLPEGQPRIHADLSFVFGKPRIVVSRDCLRFLDDRELEALLAHEMAHCVHDLRRLRSFRFFSVMMLFPMHYLLVLYEFLEREKAADRFAIEVVNDAGPLKSALGKCATIAAFGRRGRKSEPIRNAKSAPQGVYPLIRNIRDAFALVADDAIIGAAYPSLQERFQWIDEQDDQRLGRKKDS